MLYESCKAAVQCSHSTQHICLNCQENRSAFETLRPKDLSQHRASSAASADLSSHSHIARYGMSGTLLITRKASRQITATRELLPESSIGNHTAIPPARAAETSQELTWSHVVLRKLARCRTPPGDACMGMKLSKQGLKHTEASCLFREDQQDCFSLAGMYPFTLAHPYTAVHLHQPLRCCSAQEEK